MTLVGVVAVVSVSGLAIAGADQAVATAAVITTPAAPTIATVPAVVSVPAAGTSAAVTAEVAIAVIEGRADQSRDRRGRRALAQVICNGQNLLALPGIRHPACQDSNALCCVQADRFRNLRRVGSAGDRGDEANDLRVRGLRRIQILGGAFRTAGAGGQRRTDAQEFLRSLDHRGRRSVR